VGVCVENMFYLMSLVWIALSFKTVVPFLVAKTFEDRVSVGFSEE